MGYRPGIPFWTGCCRGPDHLRISAGGDDPVRVDPGSTAGAVLAWCAEARAQLPGDPVHHSADPAGGDDRPTGELQSHILVSAGRGIIGHFGVYRRSLNRFNRQRHRPADFAARTPDAAAAWDDRPGDRVG